MTKKRWTTDEQLVWLRARIPEFLEHQTRGELEEWFGPVYQDFLDNWPLGLPTEEEVEQAEGDVDAAKKLHIAWGKGVSLFFFREFSIQPLTGTNVQRVYSWFHNNTRANSKPKGKVINLNKTSRMMHPHQAYEHLYKSTVMPKIKEAYATYLKETEGKDEDEILTWMAFRGREAKNLLAKESEDVKERVENYRNSKRGKHTSKKAKIRYVVACFLC